MPSVIAPGTQMTQVDCSPNKVLVDQIFDLHLLCPENVIERIAVVFEPKLALSLSIEGWVFKLHHFIPRENNRIRVCTVHDHLRIRIDEPHLRPNPPGEPIMPTIKSKVRPASINIVIVIVDPFQGSG